MGIAEPQAGATGAPRTVDRKLALAQVLRQRIITMELPPGAVLDEIALSEEFGLSRPPVRELMRQMAAEGYIELEANRAARVASMNYQSLRNFFLAAPLIYTATTKLAALDASAAEIADLKAIQAKFRHAVQQGDVDSRVYYNDQFHLAIGKMAHNPYLLPSLNRLLIDHARLAKTSISRVTATCGTSWHPRCSSTTTSSPPSNGMMPMPQSRPFAPILICHGAIWPCMSPRRGWIFRRKYKGTSINSCFRCDTALLTKHCSLPIKPMQHRSLFVRALSRLESRVFQGAHKQQRTARSSELARRLSRKLVHSSTGKP